MNISTSPYGHIVSPYFRAVNIVIILRNLNSDLSRFVNPEIKWSKCENRVGLSRCFHTWAHF